MKKGLSVSKMGVVLIIMLMQFALAGILATPAHAGDVDVLINRLVEKGVLTRADAEAILKEAKTEEKGQVVKTAEAEKLPSWLDKISIGGDLRLRYEYRDRQEGSGAGNYNLGRFRYRLHIAGQVMDNLKVVFGLASSSGDPRSQNVTFGTGSGSHGGAFAGEPMAIDLAYVQYNPVKTLKLLGGKFGNPIWTPSQLIWDTDIKTEGAAATLDIPAGEDLSFFVNTDFFVLQMKGDKTPYLFAIQPGVNVKFAPGAHLKLAGTYYSFSKLQGNTPAYSPKTNTYTADGLKYNYNMLDAGAELGFENLADILPYVALYGEYVHNPDPSTSNDGYLAGIKFGAKKVKEFGQWKVSYDYRREGRDAVPDMLPESDFFNGYTDVYGSKATFTFGLSKNIYTALNYFNGHSADTAVTSNKKWDVVQLDLGMSF